MTFSRPFLVGAGQVADHEMRSGSQAISNVWGGGLIECSCLESPINVLASLPEEEGLACLLGDAAVQQSFGGSWLESLGGWRQPVILIVDATSSGEFSGIASAYSALCEVFHIPLIGIIQLGGNWNPNQRRLDGLPWCGCIGNYRNGSSFANSSQGEQIAVKEVAAVLHRRMRDLNLF